MTTLVISHLIQVAGTALRALGDRFFGIFDRIQRARAMAQRFQALASLSDAELARRGLKREDISQVVLAAGQRP